MPQHQVALQLGAAEVEHPMAEAQLLSREILLFLPANRDCWSLSRAYNFEGGHMHLDFSRDEVQVPGRLRAQLDPPGYQNDRLGPETGCALHDIGRSPGGVTGELHQSSPITEIDEHQPPKVSPAVNPTTQPHVTANVRPGQCAGEVGS